MDSPRHAYRSTEPVGLWRGSFFNMKDAYYFPHETNASRDEKMAYLLKKHGYLGYGLFWFIVEMMHESENSKLKIDLIDGYPIFNTDITLIQEVITTCIKCGLFQKDEYTYWSDRVIRNKEDLEKKRLLKSIAGRKGMAVRWKYNTVKQADTNHNKVKESKGKESKDKDIVTNKRRLSHFVKPTPEEIQGYCKERNNNVSGKAFYDFYESKGWVVGRSPM
jgi:uncharacterized protein YqgQ